MSGASFGPDEWVPGVGQEYAASGKAQLHCSHSQHAKLANVLAKAARDANSLTRKLVNI